MKTAIFSGILCTLFGIFAGLEIGWRQAEQKLAKPMVLTKACPQPVAAPAISRIECLRACYSKARMEKVASK